MSTDQARLFIQRVQADNAFRTRVLAEEDVDARMALIRAEGFDCSAGDIAALLVALSDAHPQSIRGGLGHEIICGSYGVN